MARTLWYRLAGTTAWTSASGLAGDIVLAPGNYEVHDGLNLYSGTVTAEPTVSLSSAVALNEGNSGTTTFLYTITKSDPSVSATVNWTFAAGGTSADDFAGGAYPTGSGVSIPAGSATGTFAISVQGDVAIEGDESFTVSITAPAGFNLSGTGSATGTILNDDTALPTVSLSNAITQAEGNSGSTAYIFTVTRSNTTGTISVPWTFSAGTTSADDFVGGSYPTGGNVSIAAGAATGTLTINVQGDTAVEGNDAFTVSITAPSGYQLGATTSTTATITNDDLGGYPRTALGIALASDRVVGGPLDVDYTFPEAAGIYPSYVLREQLAGDAAFTTPVEGEGSIRETNTPIQQQWLAEGFPERPILASQPSATMYYRCALFEDSDDGLSLVQASPWSNVVSAYNLNITTITSASITEGLQLNVPLTAGDPFTATIAGGVDAASYEVSGSTLRWAANGTKTYTGTDDIYPVIVRYTTAEGYRDQAFTATVLQGVTFPTGAAAIYDAANLNNLKQSNAGTTSVATVGDPVGYWADTSGNARHLSSTGNDTTRPTFQQVSGKNVVRFDGNDDVLRWLGSMGLYSAGSAVVGVAIASSTPGAARTLFGSGKQSTNNPRYELLTSETGSGSKASGFIRNDANATQFPQTNALGTGVWNTTPKTVIAVDDGSGVTLYVNGVAGTRIAYTRANPLTTDMVAMGAIARGTPANFFQGDVCALAAYPGNSVSISALHAALASKLP